MLEIDLVELDVIAKSQEINKRILKWYKTLGFLRITNGGVWAKNTRLTYIIWRQKWLNKCYLKVRNLISNVRN